LGAGRSGTTTLTAVLREHPEIFLSTPKEPTFFSEPFQVTRTPIKYAKLFDGASEFRAVGEASHAYLSHPDAAQTLRAFFPDARFVVTFRNPADRALAMYSYMLENGYEHHRSFERALAAEDDRFASARFARNCPHYFWNFMYFRSGRFGEQVDRYLEHYPRDRFHFTTLYDLQRDPNRVVGAIEAFLGVTPTPVGPLPRHGSSKGIRSIPLQHLERRVVRRLARHDVPLMATARDRLNAWNRGRPPTMEPATRARLLQDYDADLTRLTELTGIDVLAAQSDQPDPPASTSS
ncbi:MAG: sulfotransferase, partial [Acidimicrobiia bacterium]